MRLLSQPVVYITLISASSNINGIGRSDRYQVQEKSYFYFSAMNRVIKYTNIHRHFHKQIKDFILRIPK